MKKVYALKDEYNALIDKRMEDMSLPERDRSISTKRFMKLEYDLNYRSTQEKIRCGILAKRMVSFCKECFNTWELQTRDKKDTKHKGKTHYKNREIDFDKCSDHAYLDAVGVQGA